MVVIDVTSGRLDLRRMRDDIGKNAKRFDVAFGDVEGDPFAYPRPLGDGVTTSSMSADKRRDKDDQLAARWP